MSEENISKMDIKEEPPNTQKEAAKADQETPNNVQEVSNPDQKTSNADQETSNADQEASNADEKMKITNEQNLENVDNEVSIADSFTVVDEINECDLDTFMQSEEIDAILKPADFLLDQNEEEELVPEFHGEGEEEEEESVNCKDDSKLTVESIDLTKDAEKFDFEESVDKESIAQKHPYLNLINSYKITDDQMKITEIPKVKSLGSTPLFIISTKAQLTKVVESLKKEKEIAVSVYADHIEYESVFNSIQISTKNSDYIIDLFKLKDEITILNEVLTNPEIVKIMYGYNFLIVQIINLYVINVINLERVFKKLGENYSLLTRINQDYKVEKVPGFFSHLRQKRPLDDDTKKALRLHTHYLIHLYHINKNRLLTADAKLYTDLLEEFRDTTKSINTNRHAKAYNTQMNNLKRFQVAQTEALKRLFAWRDEVARKLNKPFTTICSNRDINHLVKNLPMTCDSVNVKSLFLKQDLPKVIGIIRSIRMGNKVEEAMKDGCPPLNSGLKRKAKVNLQPNPNKKVKTSQNNQQTTQKFTPNQNNQQKVLEWKTKTYENFKNSINVNVPRRNSEETESRSSRSNYSRSSERNETKSRRQDNDSGLSKYQKDKNREYQRKTTRWNPGSNSTLTKSSQVINTPASFNFSPAPFLTPPRTNNLTSTAIKPYQMQFQNMNNGQGNNNFVASSSQMIASASIPSLLNFQSPTQNTGSFGLQAFNAATKKGNLSTLANYGAISGQPNTYDFNTTLSALDQKINTLEKKMINFQGKNVEKSRGMSPWRRNY